MPTFTVDVRAANVLLMLRNGEKSAKFAVANALRQTGLAIQQDVRARVRQRFIVRKSDFIMRQAAILKFPSVPQQRMEVSVRVGDKKNLLLPEFEKGAERVGQRALHAIGVTGVAVPFIGGARPSKGEVIPEPSWVSRLRLVKGRRSRSGAILTRMGNIAMAIGGRVRLLYHIAHGSVRIPPRLGFYDIALRQTARFPGRLLGEIANSFQYKLTGIK